MEELFDREFYGNTVQSYLIAIGIFLLGLLLVRLFRKSVLKRLKIWATSTETNLDDYIVNAVERFGMPMLNFAALYFGINYLHLNEFGEKAVRGGGGSAFPPQFGDEHAAEGL